jgi:hypothetical protein
MVPSMWGLVQLRITPFRAKADVDLPIQVNEGARTFFSPSCSVLKRNGYVIPYRLQWFHDRRLKEGDDMVYLTCPSCAELCSSGGTC